MAVVVSPPTERVGEGIQHMKEGCLSPHRIHAGVVMRLHRCKLALCGSVSVRELSANLSTCSVRVETVADQSCVALLSSRNDRFCLDRHTGAVTKTSICVPFLHSGLGLLPHLLGCCSWVLLHSRNNDLVWLEGWSSLSGFLPGLLSGHRSDNWVPGAGVRSCFGNL